MEEPPPTEPPRRRPEPKSTRRSGPARAAFTSAPDPDPEAPTEPPPPPRPRDRPLPPAVLFQPPTEPERPVARPQPMAQRDQPAAQREQPPTRHTQPSPQSQQPPSARDGSDVEPAEPAASPKQIHAKATTPDEGPERFDRHRPVLAAPDAPATGDPAPAGQEPAPAARKVSTAKRVTTGTKTSTTKRTTATTKATAGAEATAGERAAGAAKQAGSAKKATAAKKAAAKKTAGTKAAAKKTTARKATTVTKTTAEVPVAGEVPPEPPAALTPAATGPTVPEPPANSAGPRDDSAPESEPLPVRSAAVEQPPEVTPAGVPEVRSGAPDDTGTPDRTASGRTSGSGSRPSAVRRILDHPGYAPELLALAAVRELGPAALAWAAETRAAYPNATDAGLARLATRRYVQLSATGGALSMATGLLAPLVELAAVTWAQAMLVLHLAAAHGHDPTQPDRAADLLVLTRVHPDEESARAALAAAEYAISGTDESQSTDESGTDEGRSSGDIERGGPAYRLAEAGWRLGAPIIAQTANWLTLRLAVRRLSGATTLVTVLGSAAATERLAARATAHYRGTGFRRTGSSGALPPARGTHTSPLSSGHNQPNQLRGSSA